MLERGLREPGLGTIVKLSDALEAPLGSLLRGMEWSVGKKAFVIEDRDGERGE